MAEKGYHLLLLIVFGGKIRAKKSRNRTVGEMDMATAVTLVSTICGGLATLGGLYYSKGIDAHIKLMRAKRESNLEELERTKVDIAQILNRLGVAEKHNEECVQRHQDCERRCAIMEGKLSVLENRISGIN